MLPNSLAKAAVTGVQNFAYLAEIQICKCDVITTLGVRVQQFAM